MSRRNRNKNEDNLKEKTDDEEIDTNENLDLSLSNSEGETVIKSNPNRVVVVRSKELVDSKIIVIYKKIKGQDKKLRDAYNIYQFSSNECLMSERDAILFWKDRIEVVGIKNDVEIFTEDFEFQYDYEKSKDLYEIVIEELENSEQRD